MASSTHAPQPPQWVAWREGADRPAALTPWTLVHAAVGAVAYAALRAAAPTRAWGEGARFAAWFALHALYEAKDWYLTYARPPPPGGHTNSWVNSLGDQAAACAGYAAAAAARLSLAHALVALAAAFVVLASPIMTRAGRGAAVTPWGAWDARG